MSPQNPGWQLYVLYGVSGMVGVAYEVLWARMLTLQLGVSVFGVVVTVAAFMTGLGLGSLGIVLHGAGIRHPLRWLALLEALVALFAGLLPWGNSGLGHFLDAAAGQLSTAGWQALMVVTAFLLLALPATALGAGFPLLIQALGHQPGTLGRFYGVNTLGAVLGALLPLFLLPVMGWGAALQVVALLGAGVAAGWFALSLRQAAPSGGGNPPSVPRPAAGWLWSYALIGAASLSLEVAWTRLFGLVMLRTEYVLALILASFLSGIGLGSWVAARRHSSRLSAWLPWCAAAAILLGLWALPGISAWVERSRWDSLILAMAVQGALILLLTLPVTLVLGAWLPIVARQSGASGLWLYGANSLGAAVGALVTGWVLIPAVGTTATLVIAAFLMLGVGLGWNRPFRIWWLAPLTVMLLAGVPLAGFPEARNLLPQALAGSRDLYRYEDAVAITQVVEQPDGQRLLLTDLQRRDASSEPTAVFVQENQARLPLLLHPDPRSVLFEGLGTGISDAGSAAFPDLRRSAVELSRGAILAARHWFAPFNRAVLADTAIHQDDARHFLSATADRYDVIIGDVFHPDLAGVSSLLSVQQFRRARARLTDQGIFVQWIALNQFDPATLAIVLRTFRAAFPQGQLFLDGMHLALVGPNGRWQGASPLLANLQRLSPEQREAATAGEGGMTWLGRYWGPIPDSSGPVQDEWSPLIEFRLPRLRYGPGVDVAGVLEQLVEVRPQVEKAQALLEVPAERQAAFQGAYIGTELLVRSWMAALRGQAGQDDRLLRMAFEANPHDRWTAYALSDKMLAHLDGAVSQGLDREQALKKLLRINPWQTEVLRALWLEQVRRREPEAEATRLQLLNLDPLDRQAGSAKN